MSKEMREQIDRVKNWKQFLNENNNDNLLKTVIIKGVGENPSEIVVNIVKKGDYYEMINNKNGETINLNNYKQIPTKEEIRFEVIGKYGNGKIDYSSFNWQYCV